jgi:hypothetical protein
MLRSCTARSHGHFAAYFRLNVGLPVYIQVEDALPAGSKAGAGMSLSENSIGGLLVTVSHFCREKCVYSLCILLGY